jgi:hypothetical protein
MKDLHYAKNAAPPEYRCSKCGATGCKLWRELYVMAVEVKLMCVGCAFKSKRLKPVPVDDNGMCADRSFPTVRTDQVADLGPAVPEEAPGDSYWGYMSVPDAGVKWWKSLPTYP